MPEAVLASARVLVLMGPVSACLWALPPPLFIDGGNAFIPISETAGSLASESVYPPSFLAYSLPVMLSLSSAIFFLGDSYDYLGLPGVCPFMVIIGFALRSGEKKPGMADG